MNHTCQPAAPEAVEPVGLLAEHEEALVEQPDLVGRLAPDEQRRAVERLDLARAVVVEAAAVEGVEELGARPELAQEEVLGREPPERRLAAHRALERAVRVGQPRADDGGTRMRVGERDQRVERSLATHASELSRSQ